MSVEICFRSPDLAVDPTGTAIPCRLSVDDVLRIAGSSASVVTIDPAGIDAIRAGSDAIERLIAGGAAVYGATTGVGGMVGVDIPADAIGRAQADLLRSHAAGIGPALPDEIVRAAMLIRVNALARGYSGVRVEVIERIAELFNSGLTPLVPEVGSLGASGDLVPSAHAFLALLGEGALRSADGTVHDAADLTAVLGAPMRLCGKEGLALMNGTHFMAAHGCVLVAGAGRMMDWLDSAAALSYEALACSRAPLDPRVHRLRNSAGQLRSAETILGLLGGSSAVRKPGEGRQDPYSVRCAPQVHGSCRDVVEYLRGVVTDEVNAVTDNPLILAEWPHIVENGNFHGQRIAVAFDTLRNALADAASISERRTFALLTAAHSNGLPPFLATRPASSGFMMVQYTAASLVSQLKQLAAPISCDTIPTSGGQEDHVSMGMAAARLAVRALELFEQVVAIEIMCAARAIDLRGVPIGTGTSRLLRRVRTVVEPMVDDRPPGPDIERLTGLIRTSTGVSDDDN